jgi:hypothetical protein
MKKIFVLFVAVSLLLSFKSRQDFDEEKMKRDLEIAKNVLGTLIKTGSESFFGSNAIDASYIKGYGVVLTIPEHLVYFHDNSSWSVVVPPMPPKPEMAPDIDMNVHFDNEVEVEVDDELLQERQRAKADMERAREEAERAREDVKRQREEMRAERAEARERYRVNVGKSSENEVDWEKIVITFFTDYADLIGQLQPDEKIIINKKSPHKEFIFVWRDDESTQTARQQGNNLSAEVTRRDISEFKSGKIDRPEFVARIKIEKEEAPKKIADLEMFASIYDRFFSRDLSKSYYSRGNPTYELLDGYGVVFHLNATSPGRSTGNIKVYSYRSGATTQVESSSREENDELYPQFKTEIKDFLLDYGRTIRSMKEGDKVMLDIRIDGCQNCEVPEKLEVSTDYVNLMKYDQQKISKEKALERIELKETF